MPERQVPPYLPTFSTGVTTRGFSGRRSATGGSVPALTMFVEHRRLLVVGGSGEARRSDKEGCSEQGRLCSGRQCDCPAERGRQSRIATSAVPTIIL